MRKSLMSAIFAILLLFECYALSTALPKAEDGSMENEAFSSLLSNQETENSLSDADLTTLNKGRAPKVIVIAADPSLWRDLRVLPSRLSMFKRTADESNQVSGYRDAGQQLNIPILRRDTMRCMVGRVYRPCWDN